MLGGFSVFTQGVLMDFFPLSSLIKSFLSCSSLYLMMYVCSVTLKCLTLKQIQNDNISSNTGLNFFLFICIYCWLCSLQIEPGSCCVCFSEGSLCSFFFFFLQESHLFLFLSLSLFCFCRNLSFRFPRR